jgi:hypothetical protein
MAASFEFRSVILHALEDSSGGGFEVIGIPPASGPGAGAARVVLARLDKRISLQLARRIAGLIALDNGQAEFTED